MTFAEVERRPTRADKLRGTVTDDRLEDGEGGESAVMPIFICPQCGAVLDGTVHRVVCNWLESATRHELTHDSLPIPETESGSSFR